MKSLIAISVAAILVEVCIAHICLLSPPQRGSMVGLNTPAAPDCILTVARCGGRPRTLPALSLHRGQNFTFIFQKNLDHFNKTSPGKFVLSFGTERGGTQLRQLLSVDDSDTPSLHIYAMNVTIPTDIQPDPGMEYIIHAVYLPNNSQAPEAFYQCSDIRIF